jgi:hypothetical protein
MAEVMAELEELVNFKALVEPEAGVLEDLMAQVV